MALSIDKTWPVMKSFLENPVESTSIISENQISSYNRFVDEIPDILKSFSTDLIPGDLHSTKKFPYFTIQFEKPRFEKPQRPEGGKIYPTECSIRNLQYDSRVFVDARVIKYTEGEKTVDVKKNLLLMKLPVMVRSKLCNIQNMEEEELAAVGEDVYEMGGFFYVTTAGNKKENGQGRVLLKRVVYAQERIAYNKIYFDTKKHRKSEKNLPYISHVEFRSMTGYASMTIFSLGVTPERNVRVCLPWMPNEYVPVLILLYALGKDLSFFRNHGINHEEDLEYFERCLEDAYGVNTREEAMAYIAKGKKEEKLKYVDYVLNESLFCNLNEGSRAKRDNLKALFLMHLYQKKLQHSRGEIMDTERDYFSNKRVQTTGTTMTQHFYSSLKRFMTDIKKKVAEAISNESIVDPLIYYEEVKMTNAWKKALVNNNWNVTLSNKESVTQIADNLNRMAKMASLNKIYLGMGGKEGEKVKVIEPRDLHLSQIGFIDPYDTPEGGKVGLLKNAAVTCCISPYTLLDPELLLQYDTFHPLDEMENPFLYTKVFHNGKWIGGCEDADDLCAYLRDRRFEGELDRTTTIHQTDLEVHILTDQGRLLRPLLVCKDGQLVLTPQNCKDLNSGKMTFENLYEEGIIQLLGDFEIEERKIYVAENPSNIDPLHSHCEIHETAISGFLTNDNPFYNRNPAARNCYEDSMKKQAQGYPETNFMNTYQDGLLLNYPQKPLCSTRYSYHLKSDELPAEQSMVVAFISDDNEEDCIILNKASIDRGLGQYTLVTIYSIEIGEDSQLRKPDEKICNLGEYDYSLIGEDDAKKSDAIVKVGQVVNKNQVLISVITKNSRYDSDKKTDPKYYEKEYVSESIVYESKHHGVVESVQILDTENNKKVVRVRVLQKRRPMIGDKFSAKHGQKGTVAHIRNQEDMPFTPDGITPDVIFGPAAIPSRMTAALLVEVLMGKAIASENKTENIKWVKALKAHLLPDGRGDSTAYIPELTVEKISSILKQKGWNPHGEEFMVDGITGLPLKSLVFCGLASFHQLLHIAELKAHARSFGPTTSMFRQPTGGKKTNGGMRNGVQERDAKVAADKPGMLLDALFVRSDPFKIRTCPGCGTFRDDPNFCSLCDST